MRIQPKNSAGHDDISNRIIKYICPIIAAPLSVIINQSFTTEIFPQKLKVAKVIPIYKKDEETFFLLITVQYLYFQSFQTFLRKLPMLSS